MASAGTGKTYALTGRLLSLLSLGVPFERIVALTFTRAAAAEILDALVNRLARAATDPATAAREAAMLPGNGRGPGYRFLGLLRQVLDGMHRSPIGTLDSFLARMVRLFPFEFGLSGDFSILDGHDLVLEKRRVLAAILRDGETEAQRAARGDFLEAFKRATFGSEEKRLHDLLDRFVSDYHDLYLNAAPPRAWGARDRIWPTGKTWWRVLTQGERETAVKVLKQCLDFDGLAEPQQERLAAFLEMAAGFGPGSIVTSPGNDLLKKLLACRPDLQTGAAEVVVQRRRVPLGPEACAAALRLAGHIVACTMESRIEATRGLRDILERYEVVYAREVRRLGHLSFADLTHLATRGLDAETRLALDFRLDGFYDHWAIDEFQDTSRSQWAAVVPLLEEVIQDAEGRRTFFAVGDVKQAIYGWRGGDSRLLGEVRDYYGIPGDHLSQSHRCAPAIVAAVNGVFGDLTASGLPAAVAARWQGLWQRHESAVRHTTGWVEVREVPRSEEQAEAWHEAIGGLLLEAQPWQRSLSSAVLVRSNAQGQAITESLRARGIPARWTGDKAIADNPVVEAMLDLFRFAEHPGDTFAWQHLLMTPLRGAFGDRPESAADRLSVDVLGLIRDHGFAPAVESWLERLSACRDLDGFSRSRLRALLDAAEAYDRSGRRSCLDFADFVASYTVSDVPAERTVQVMTVHRSKGLGFDVVVAPLFRGRQGLGSASGADVLLGPREDGSGARRWILLAPPKDIAESDEALAEAGREAAEEACFEELCVLYVAMTRARRGLFLLLPPPPRSPGALHLHTLVRARLCGDAAPAGCLARLGEPESVLGARGEARAVPAAKGQGKGAPCQAEGKRRRYPRRTPSVHGITGRRAGDLFLPAARQGVCVGAAVHAFFEHLTWLNEVPLDEMLERWRLRVGRTGVDLTSAEGIIRGALEAPDFRRALARPAGRVALWRERSFEVLLDGEWVSGTFDRVVLTSDEAGRAESVRVLDFKTDRVAGAEEIEGAVGTYRSQLGLYCRVLRLLTGVEAMSIEGSLAFTHCGRVVPVTSPGTPVRR
ncbi:MAG: UvrD-helicase domain-containing protein [Lentisphaeria bacterium]|nr:UvrD-helicase domain-containing protein [Lentisphaeria bacterium]